MARPLTMAQLGTDGAGHRRDRGGQPAIQGTLGLHLDPGHTRPPSASRAHSAPTRPPSPTRDCRDTIQGTLGLHLDRPRAEPESLRPASEHIPARGLGDTAGRGRPRPVIAGTSPGGTRKRRSVARQSGRFKLGRPGPGHTGWKGPCTPHFQSSSVLTVGGRLGCNGVSVTTLHEGNGRSFLLETSASSVRDRR